MIKQQQQDKKKVYVYGKKLSTGQRLNSSRQKKTRSSRVAFSVK